MNEKYIYYLSLTLMLLVLILMIKILFFAKVGMIEKETGALGEPIRAIAI